MPWTEIGGVLLLPILPAVMGAFVATAQLILRGDTKLTTPELALRFAVNALMGVMAAIVFAPTSMQLAFLCGLAGPFILRTSLSRGVFESKRAEELRRSVERAEEAVKKEPEKPKHVWELSKAQLDEYINRNLAQVRQIFAITIGVMTAGFVLVVWGVYRALDSQIQVAIVTAVSGIITQTIGATFLLIYRSTIKQANDYVGTLERINAVGMAVSIMDLIPDEKVEAKTKARLDIIKQILITQPRRSHAD